MRMKELRKKEIEFQQETKGPPVSIEWRILSSLDSVCAAKTKKEDQQKNLHILKIDWLSLIRFLLRLG